MLSSAKDYCPELAQNRNNFIQRRKCGSLAVARDVDLATGRQLTQLIQDSTITVKQHDSQSVSKTYVNFSMVGFRQRENNATFLA
jgi:hypothetical protein